MTNDPPMTHQGNPNDLPRMTGGDRPFVVRARSFVLPWSLVGHWSFVICALLLCAGPAAAQRPRVKIEEARVGLPPGRFVGERDASQRGAHVAKRNVWAPVYVKLEVLREYEGGIQLKVEAADADDLRTALYVPLVKTLADRRPGEKIDSTEFGYVPYVRCGDRSGSVTLTVMTDPPPGEDPRPLSDAYRIGSGGTYVPFRDAPTYV